MLPLEQLNWWKFAHTKIIYDFGEVICVWITHPFPNFNGTTIEVWEWISNDEK